jgi:ElaB/YqjD/DUF883 family membrane-anchored ribosome-binding protein
MATATQTERVTEPCCWPTREALEQNLREVRRVATTTRHAAEDSVAEAALNIRRHPLRAVGGAAVVAGMAGVLIGFGAGWFARARRSE